MKKDEDNISDDFYRNLIQETGLEEPSGNFTALVMDNIRKEASYGQAFAYKPLIPKYIWWLFSLVLAIVCIYTVLDPGGFATWDMPMAHPDFIKTDWITDILNTLRLPDTFTYGLVSFALFASIQTFLLKTYWNRRVSI